MPNFMPILLEMTELEAFFKSVLQQEEEEEKDDDDDDDDYE